MDKVIVITWVSCSGKTTLQEELTRRWYESPINFTTRSPRSKNYSSIDEDWDYNSKEFGEYIFLNKSNFLKKLRNWDFLEHVQYCKNWYWISKFLPNWKVVLILDPIGRNQVLRYFSDIWVEVVTYYLEISKKVQDERLQQRKLDDKQVISRKKDFERFSPTNKCRKLNWTVAVKELADIIENA